MAEIAIKTAFRVDIIESERGWGQKIDESRYFETDAEAKAFVNFYNKKHNTSSTVPDWYMYASYVGKVE